MMKGCVGYRVNTVMFESNSVPVSVALIALVRDKQNRVFFRAQCL